MTTEVSELGPLISEPVTVPAKLFDAIIILKSVIVPVWQSRFSYATFNYIGMALRMSSITVFCRFLYFYVFRVWFGIT